MRMCQISLPHVSGSDTFFYEEPLMAPVNISHE